MKRDQIERLKHNAKLDVRLPDQLKDEFLARCREEGVSSGAVIRSLIIDFVLTRPRPFMARLGKLKETIMKRSKWIAGGVGGAVAALSAASVVMAPSASADTVQVDYEFRLQIGDEDLSFESGHETQLGEAWLILPQDEDGNGVYSILMRVRECAEAERATDPDCEVVFDVKFAEILASHENQYGGVNITDERVVANPVMFGQMGQTLNYFSVIEDGEATLTLKTLTTVVES